MMQDIKNNKYFYCKDLPKQTVFFEEDGEESAELLRLGRLNTELYRNRTCITTIYGKQAFVPTINITVETDTNDKCFIIINIINKETKTTAKQLIIKSQKNNLPLTEMAKLYDEIINIVEAEGNEQVVTLIKTLRKKEDIVIDEKC